MTIKNLLAATQYIIPKYWLTRLMGRLAKWRTPFFKSLFIKTFIKVYQVDMALAEQENPEKYESFESFFIRPYKSSIRPIASGQDDLVSPIDGVIAKIGPIQQSILIQAKGFHFTLEELLASDQQVVEYFKNGQFMTLYLAPQDYHRVHMPLQGTLEKTIYVPGAYFSVNAASAALIPNLYSRNERFITIFSTPAGKMAVLFVGALIVGSIKTVWQDAPIKSQTIVKNDSPFHIRLEKGQELGYFTLGSSVILLFEPNRTRFFSHLASGSRIQFGQSIGKII